MQVTLVRVSLQERKAKLAKQQSDTPDPLLQVRSHCPKPVVFAETLLLQAGWMLSRTPRVPSHINSMHHACMHMSGQL